MRWGKKKEGKENILDGEKEKKIGKKINTKISRKKKI